jgi:hypothetical protein
MKAQPDKCRKDLLNRIADALLDALGPAAHLQAIDVQQTNENIEIFTRELANTKARSEFDAAKKIKDIETKSHGIA